MTDGTQAGGSFDLKANASMRSIVDADSRFAVAMKLLRLDFHRSFITALSGGADSTALALLAQRYANTGGKRHQAVIIDHGLRHCSFVEALNVQERMKFFGVESQIISIDCPRPKSGLQEWARLHRHRILMSVARDQQAVLLFAHHADDQAETIAMRLLRGSGLVGLSGIPAVRTQHGVTISRPLLDWSHRDLSIVCKFLNCPFEVDPSNSDRQFERVRVRQLLANLDLVNKGPTSSQIRRLGALSGGLHTAASNANNRFFCEAIQCHETGYVTAVMKHLTNLPKFRWALAIRRLVMAISGKPYAPSSAAMDQLRNRINAGLSATIGGCHFSPMRTSRNSTRDNPKIPPNYRLFRETGRHTITMPVKAGDEVVFAGCWHLKSQRAGALQAFGDLGKFLTDGDRKICNKNMPEEWHLIPHRARKAIPVLKTLEGGLIYPQITNHGEHQIDPALTAQFFGMARDPVYLAYTQSSFSS